MDRGAQCREIRCRVPHLGQGALKLKLLEGVGDDILHVVRGALDAAQQVEQRVVGQLEARQQRARLALHDGPA